MTIEEYIKEKTKNSNGYFWGVWGDSKPDKFFIVDKEFNIIFESVAFNDRGRFTEEVNQAFEKYGIKKDLDKMGTDNNLEKLKERIERKYKLHLLAMKKANNFNN